MILAAEKFGIKAFRQNKITGIFAEAPHCRQCEQGQTITKLGAIGVRITQGVTYHGFAFNVCPNLDHYKLIVPCGMANLPPCSIESLLEPADDTCKSSDNFDKITTMIKAQSALSEAFCKVFDYKIVT